MPASLGDFSSFVEEVLAEVFGYVKLLSQTQVAGGVVSYIFI